MFRRDFLRSTLATPLVLGSATPLLSAAPAPKKIPVAGVVTVYKRNTHADVILGKILNGYRQQGGHGPGLELVSLYVDQVPDSDLSRQLAEQHGVRICKTIPEALTHGTDELQVGGVLSIGEHGNYPYTEKTKQHMYPRRRFFDAIAATMKKCGKSVPVFNDKHLAYRWQDAWHMVKTARQQQIPFLAGSSVPVGWREPQWQLPLGSQVTDALAVGYGGFESYGFHAIEGLQCLVERRQGGESGVAEVQVVTGKAIGEAASQGRFSAELLKETLAICPGSRGGENPLELLQEARKSAVYLIRYRDGLQAAVVMSSIVRENFAASVRVKDKGIQGTRFALEYNVPYGHFAWLVEAIEHMVKTGKPPYPVERTLWTTRILDAAMHSLANDGSRIKTDEFDAPYQPTDWHFAKGKVGSSP